ncbi:MAG: InlB B-repeat-containing protein [Kiritimatiellae bacterium]|nr:InlB B-repeat-containing protein [Kiritimatiellia bacterium]
MKKTMLMAFAAILAGGAAAGTPTQQVYWGYVLGDSSMVSFNEGYVAPKNKELKYVSGVSSTDIGQPFSLTNSPSGWKRTKWLSHPDSVLIWESQYYTEGEEWNNNSNSLIYVWHTLTDKHAVRGIVAKFEPINVTFSFDTAGGTSKDPITRVSTNLFSLGTYTGTRTGYDFAGWTNAAGVVVQEGRTGLVLNKLNDPTVRQTNLLTRCFMDTRTQTYGWVRQMPGNLPFGVIGNADTNIWLYASWTGNVYKVQYDPNGGKFTSDGTTSLRQKDRTFGQPYGTLYGVAFEGKTLKGWYTAKTGGTPITSSTLVSTPSNHTIYAQWTTNNYSLTTAVSPTGSGSVTTSPSGGSFDYDTHVTLNATPNDGWLFSRWQEDGSTLSNRTITVTSNATYTAVFTSTVYTVTFYYYDSNASWVSQSQPVAYNGNAVPPSPDSYTNCPGRTFSGWIGDYERVTSSRSINGDYRDNLYNVHYDPNCEDFGGSMADLRGQECYKEWDLPENRFVRPGYSFVEWNTKSDGTGTRYDDKQKGVRCLSYDNGGTVTLYAQWSPISYTIAFSGGSGAEGEMAAIPAVYDQAVVLPANAFSKTGCEFLQWAFGTTSFQDCATVSNLTTTADATVTLTAVWDAPYYIAFDANGGEGAMDVQRFERGETKALSSNEFSRAGYAFSGWATNAAEAAALNVKYADGQVVADIGEVAETNTLYAVWATNAYYVAFDANGGEGDAMAPQRFFYDQAQNLTSNTYSRGELWRFDGWSNTVAGVVYADGASVSNLCTEADATNTLVAVWADNRTDLSKAMHCENMQWHGIKQSPADSESNLWTAREGAGLGYEGSGSCAEQVGPGGNALVSSVATNGTLTFWCRNASEGAAALYMATNSNIDSFFDMGGTPKPVATLDAVDGWQKLTFDIVYPGADDFYIKFAVLSLAGTVQIDQMTWTPEGGGNPEPTEADRVEASAVSVSDGEMTVSFTGDSTFAYHLLATDSLSPTNWYDFGATNVGADALQSFEIPIDAGHPQRFFRIEVIKKP